MQPGDLFLFLPPICGQLGAQREQGVLFGDWFAAAPGQLSFAAVDEPLEVFQPKAFEAW
ncbi:MAG: hypothetical protein ACOYYI_01165 [Chloroflexota bacterium]